MSNSPDRIVVARLNGGWEVRIPGSPGPGVRANTRSSAVEWAHNITRDTGGKVIFQHWRQEHVEASSVRGRQQ